MKTMLCAIAAVATLVLVAGLRTIVTAAEAADVTAKIGQPAPDFSLKDQEGKAAKLSDLKGKIVVLYWQNDACPFIQRHGEEKTFAKLDDKYRDKGVVLLAVDSTGAPSSVEDGKAWVAKNKLKYPILMDLDRKTARAYDAKTTPHCFVIDKAGKLVYQGAIDNDPEGDKKDKVNYVAQAIDELLAGKPVSVQETKSYGCGVDH